MFKKMLAAAGLALAVAGCMSVGFSSPYFYRNATVEVKDADKSGHGSGVVIGEHSILTALHVTKSTENPVIAFSNGDVVPGKVVWTDEALDLSILEVKALPKWVEPVDINCSELAWGQPVTVVGFPMNVDYAATTGTVASVDLISDSKKYPPYLQALDVTVVPGNSGGPAFNNDKELVGIADSVMVVPLNLMSPSLAGISYIVPASKFCDALPEVK